MGLIVNGAEVALPEDARVSLLDLLRDRLGLHGTKKGCNQGACGACTVLVDGERILSCLALAAQYEGRHITTIEGLSNGSLHPLQQAFMDHDAQQCGFCTPGFVVASTAFVRKNPNASLEQVRKGLGGNLCRCGTYAGMMLAVVDAAKAGKGGV